MGLLPRGLPHCCIAQRQLKSTVDYHLLAGWLKRCDEKHFHKAGLLQSPERITDLRLIDVEKRCIVKPTRSVSYAALSYTWSGSHNQFRLTQRNVQLLEEIDSLGDLTEVVAKVVMDSITVCASLQIPYLWVDSLCIVQDDYDGKHYQISNMNHIYANA
jgi:hypothetical protein